MLIALILLFVTLYFVYSLLKPSRPHHFPPGPDGLPIIGASYAVSKLDPTLDVALMKLGEKFGPVTGLYLGRFRTVIINGYESCKEVLNHDDFNSRPDFFIINSVWDGRLLGVMFANDPIWKPQRRFTLRHLRDFGFGKSSMEGLIHEEIEECLRTFRSKLKQTHDSILPMDGIFGISIINVLWATMSGKRYAHDDAEFKEILQKIATTFRSGSPLGTLINDFPFTRFLPFFSAEWKNIVAGRRAILDLLEVSIAEHEKTLDPDFSRDFIDVYLKEIKSQNEKDNKDPTFFKTELVAICSDLFAAGAESTSNSVNFGMLYMILYPEVQERVQKELDSVVGKNRLPSYNDRAELPYVEAVLNELLRVANIAPLTVPHLTSKDTTLNGYNIPKDTVVQVNLTSVHMEKSYWGDPENFRPERFLNDEGKFVKSERIIAFGMGKRQCLGEALARMNYFLFFTATLQNFKLELVPGGEKPSTVPLPGFTVAPRPFEAKLTPRI